LQQSADTLLAPESPSDWNQAMMELGATLCTPRSPQCLLCPVAKSCQARKLGLADSIPARRKKRATENITLAIAVLIDARGNTLLLPPPTPAKGTDAHQQVPALVSKMWHFPTIVVERNAAAELEAHLARILAASARKPSLRLEPLRPARHAVTYRAITLRPFRIQVSQLPRIANAKVIPLAEVISRASTAISNLTRKAASAAVAAPLAHAANA
jgi:adenine-specific DNA glycosylase